MKIAHRAKSEYKSIRATFSLCATFFLWDEDKRKRKKKESTGKPYSRFPSSRAPNNRLRRQWS